MRFSRLRFFIRSFPRFWEHAETYLKENPHLRRIVLCLDTDQPGREATEQLKEKYGKRGYAVSVRTPEKGKDWNEYLQQRNAARHRAR